MNLDNLIASGIKPIIMVDTYDFMKYCIKKYQYDNNSWHKEIWRPFMCKYFIETSYKLYSFTQEPNNQFEDHLNDFLLDFPEFENHVYLIFTN